MKRYESAATVTLDVRDFLGELLHKQEMAAQRSRDYRERKSKKDAIACGECVHPRLRSHTFADGSPIKMCPDCTKFDNKRKEVLSRGKVLKATKAAVALFDARLRQEGVQPSCHYAEMFVGDVEQWLDEYIGARRAARKAQCHAQGIVDVRGATPGGLIGPLLKSGWFDSSIKENRYKHKQECEDAAPLIGPRLESGYFCEVDHIITYSSFSYRVTPVDNRGRVWPNAPAPNPSHREVITGGKQPRIRAGNFKHSEECGVWFHDWVTCCCKQCFKERKTWLLIIVKWFKG